MRPLVIVPLACSFTGLVLTFLCIFAGNRPGFMNDYPIVTLNTSTLGHVTLPKLPIKAFSVPSQTPEDDILSQFNGISDGIGGIIDNIADNVTRSLGIEQFYNWHLRNFCEGEYEPNYRAENPTFGVKNCSKPTASYHFKIGDIIDRELQLGPLHISLEDVKWPLILQKKFDLLSVALHAALAFYGIAITATAIAIITEILVLLGISSLLLSLITWALLIVSQVSLFVSSIIVSIAMSISIQTVQDTGSAIGIVAYRGHRYLALTWCTMGVMLIAVLTFGAAIFFGRRSDKRATEK